MPSEVTNGCLGIVLVSSLLMCFPIYRALPRIRLHRVSRRVRRGKLRLYHSSCVLESLGVRS